ncbi:MAG TPA: DUF47 family protein [Gemmatimonadaceae bacterium]|nr:DUF47 family protein [Gemmatimonadaceae bacterium]
MRLIPRDEAFYDLFGQLARRLSTAARLLKQLFADPANLEQHAAALKAVEHEADEITHGIILRIDRTFVTPIDREDIHTLASELDDVVDLIDGTARRAEMFHIREVRQPALTLCDVLIRAVDHIEAAVAHMKDSRVVVARGRDIKLREEEGDQVYHQAIGDLFAGRPDAIEVIKWKELFDTLERALDQCEDVANVLESIALKHN